MRSTPKSRFKGVRWCRVRRLWKAFINFRSEHRNLGYHPTEEDAAKAYDVACLSLFNQSAKLNFPQT